MIKNARPLVWAGFLLLVLGTGCRQGGKLPPGYQGVVEYDERIVAFEVPGRIVSVPVHRGDVVKDGDLLAKLDDKIERLTRDVRIEEASIAQADLALMQAGSRTEDIASLSAQVRAAQAGEALLKKNVARMKALVESGSATQADLDKFEADLARATNERMSLEQRLLALRNGARPQELTRAKARTSAAQAVVALEAEKLVRHALVAQGEGTVLDVHVLPGELAAAGTPVATIADTHHPYVDVFVPQGSLAGVHLGSKASVRVDASPTLLAGVVEYIALRTEFTPRFLFSERERPNLVVRVRVRVDDPQQLLHAGVPAFVEIAK